MSILIYLYNANVELSENVSSNEDIVWLTVEQMALLLNVNVLEINKHIKNILLENDICIFFTYAILI